MRDDRDWWETLNRRLGRRERQNASLCGWEKRSYPCEESEEYHRDVEYCHDEEVENAILEDRSH